MAHQHRYLNARLANDKRMSQTCTHPRGGASLVAGSFDKTVEGVIPERAVLPWPRPPIGPDTAGSSGIAPAGNDEATDKEPGEPHDESDTAGCGDAAHADNVEARRPWGRGQHNRCHARQRPRHGDECE